MAAGAAAAGGEEGLIVHEFAEVRPPKQSHLHAPSVCFDRGRGITIGGAQALTALAATRFADPFLPLDGKLAQLFSANVLPAMKKRRVL